MKLKQSINRIFFFGALGGLAIAVATYFAFAFFVNQQNELAQKEKLHHLLEGVMPLLKEEVISDRVYAVAMRGRDYWATHASEGLELGIYRANRTPMFETQDTALLRKLMQGQTVPNLAFEVRDIHFANELVGRVVICLRHDPAKQILLRRHLSLTLGILFLAFLCLFFVIQYSLNRCVVLPASALAASIAKLEDYLNDRVPAPDVPTRLGIFELDRIGIALRDFAVKFHDAAKTKAKMELLAEKHASVAEIASQVSHDIRSPLSALNLVIGTMDGVSEDKRILLRSATHRINDIANQLLQKGQSTTNAASVGTSDREPLMLVVLLDSIVSEQRVQLREKTGVSIHAHLNTGYDLFAKMDASAFARAISNLITNCIESSTDTLQINVSLIRRGHRAEITIEDNGRGIPQLILERLGTRGVTHGKEGGSGLGIYHARKTVEEAGGTLVIESTVGRGTSVTISLPLQNPPWWFVEKISLSAGMKVVSVDDDQSIHDIWSDRLKAWDVEHVAFASMDAFERWAKTTPAINAVYLVDYEFLGQNGDGLTLIARLHIERRSILVTSRFDELAVRKKAEALGVKILPKGLAPFVVLES